MVNLRNEEFNSNQPASIQAYIEVLTYFLFPTWFLEPSVYLRILCHL